MDFNNQFHAQLETSIQASPGIPRIVKHRIYVLSACVPLVSPIALLFPHLDITPIVFWRSFTSFRLYFNLSHLAPISRASVKPLSSIGVSWAEKERDSDLPAQAPMLQGHEML